MAHGETGMDRGAGKPDRDGRRLAAAHRRRMEDDDDWGAGDVRLPDAVAKRLRVSRGRGGRDAARGDDG